MTTRVKKCYPEKAKWRYLRVIAFVEIPVLIGVNLWFVKGMGIKWPLHGFRDISLFIVSYLLSSLPANLSGKLAMRFLRKRAIA